MTLLTQYKCYTGLRGDFIRGPIAFRAQYHLDRVKSPYLEKVSIMPRGPSYPTIKSEVIRMTGGKIILVSRRYQMFPVSLRS